jgi:hypothetical protein
MRGMMVYKEWDYLHLFNNSTKISFDVEILLRQADETKIVDEISEGTLAGHIDSSMACLGLR